MLKRAILPAAAMLLIFSLIGCNSEDASNLSQDVGKIAKDAGHAAGNAQLVARVTAALADRKGVDMSGLHITGDNGVITIGGHVRDKGEKRKVLATANDVRGVNSVMDQLRIEGH